MPSCKDVDDDVANLRRDVTSQVLDNTYEYITEYMASGAAKSSFKPGIEGTTNEKGEATSSKSEHTDCALSKDTHVPSGSTHENGCKDHDTSPSDDQNKPSASSKLGRNKHGKSHKRTVSADVHAPLPKSHRDADLDTIPEVRQDDLGYMVPATRVPDTYTPLQAQTVTNGSLTGGSPCLDDHSGRVDGDDVEQYYLVPEMEDDISPLSPSAVGIGQDVEEPLEDPGYERAIHKTRPTSRCETTEGPVVSDLPANQDYESITTDLAPPTGSHVFHATPNDPSQEQYYEETLNPSDIDLQPSGQETQNSASHGVSSADRKASGSIHGSADNIYESPV